MAHPSSREEKPDKGIRRTIYEIIFEADTRPGKLFDIILLLAIIASVTAVLLESVAYFRNQYGSLLYAIEWLFTILFSIEYILRLISVKNPSRYAFSFFGLIDLLATIPSYLSLFLIGAQSLLVIRIFRLLRVFRIFKLTRYLGEASTLLYAMRASGPKITVFLGVVLAIVITMGSLMYLIEGPPNGFSSIPRSIYWAIVTITTVGYGDIAPKTVVGQFLASFLMILGYAIIAVPTGIVTVELAQALNLPMVESPCRVCGTRQHLADARFCRSCGAQISKDDVS
ncbi:ion transporter [bacterium]|nr:ion transporter [bacterium]